MEVSPETRESDSKASGLLNRFEAHYWKPELNKQEQEEYISIRMKLIEIQKNPNLSGTCRRDITETLREYEREILYKSPRFLSA